MAPAIGPPIMIKLALSVLDKTGLGKGGRCNCGPVYVCKEGPVFTLEQLSQSPQDY